MTISIQEFRVEPESLESEPESIVYDRSYGWEPEDMVLEPVNMIGVMGWSQKIRC